MLAALSKPAASQWWPLPNLGLQLQRLPSSHLATLDLSEGSNSPSSSASGESLYEDALTTQSEVEHKQVCLGRPVEEVEIEDVEEDALQEQAAVDAQLHEDAAKNTAEEMYPPSVHAMRLRSAASKTPEIVKTAGSKKPPKKAHWRHLKYTVIGSKRLRERHTVSLDDFQLDKGKPKKDIHRGLAKVQNYAALFREQLARPEIPADLSEKCKEELNRLSKIINRSQQVINEAIPSALNAQGAASKTPRYSSRQQPVYSQLSMTTRPRGPRQPLDIITNVVQPQSHTDPDGAFLDQLENAVQDIVAPTVMSRPKTQIDLIDEYKVTMRDLDLGLQFTLESSRTTREDCEHELGYEISFVASHIAILRRKSAILGAFAERMAGHPRVQARIGKELEAIASLLLKAFSITTSEKVIVAERQLVDMDKMNHAPGRRLRRGCMPVGRIILSDNEEDLQFTAAIGSARETKDPIWVADSQPEEKAIQRNVQPRQFETDQGVVLDLWSDKESEIESDCESEIEEMDMMDYELVETLA